MYDLSLSMYMYIYIYIERERVCLQVAQTVPPEGCETARTRSPPGRARAPGARPVFLYGCC